MIIVCCGSGGVGKTTISAALGLCCAISGYRTLVLTVDPARRLADALQISSLNNRPQKVDFPEGMEVSGELYAMMLDPKSTFDGIVKRYAPNGLRDRILSNRYYRYISRNMAGLHEFMAMEKLYEVFMEGGYDRIILDTPPSRRAIDFLEAPRHVINLLGHRYFLRLFQPYIRAGRWTGRIFHVFAAPVIKAVGQVVGAAALDDLFSFFQLWNDLLFEGFVRRASAVESILSAPSTLFFAITTPQAFPRSEAIGLAHEFVCRNFSFAGFIVNRVHDLKADLVERKESIKKSGIYEKDKLKKKISAALMLEKRLAQSDKDALLAMQTALKPGGKIYSIPFSDKPIHDLSGLLVICRHLSGR